MFGWFSPTCPCDPEAKRWVEQRLRWLTRHFGLHVLLEAPVVLPTEEFFPDPGTPRRRRSSCCSAASAATWASIPTTCG